MFLRAAHGHPLDFCVPDAVASQACLRPRPMALVRLGFGRTEAQAGADNHVGFKQVSDTPIVYRATGVWNFAHPYRKIADVALDFASYPAYSIMSIAVNGSSSPRTGCGRSHVLCRGRAALARVWSIGNVDTIAWSDSTHLRFFAHQNETGCGGEFGGNDPVAEFQDLRGKSRGVHRGIGRFLPDGHRGQGWVTLHAAMLVRLA